MQSSLKSYYSNLYCPITLIIVVIIYSLLLNSLVWKYVQINKYFVCVTGKVENRALYTELHSWFFFLFLHELLLWYLEFQSLPGISQLHFRFFITSYNYSNHILGHPNLMIFGQLFLEKFTNYALFGIC